MALRVDPGEDGDEQKKANAQQDGDEKKDGDGVTITMTGPAGVWFGVGFDAQHMTDSPYTIVVSGAGDSRFNGTYQKDGTQDGVARWRKVGGDATMNRNSDGAWYICVDHSGSWYKTRSRSDTPPASGWICGRTSVPRHTNEMSRPRVHGGSQPRRRHLPSSPKENSCSG